MFLVILLCKLNKFFSGRDENIAHSTPIVFNWKEESCACLIASKCPSTVRGIRIKEKNFPSVDELAKYNNSCFDIEVQIWLFNSKIPSFGFHRITES